MATRRGKGQRGERIMQPDRDERDEKIEALRRQIEELTMNLECQETHGSRGSSYGYASDGFKDINSLASKEIVGDSSMERYFHANGNIKSDLLEFHGRLQPEEFLDWLSVVEKLFEYKEITRRPKSKINYYKASKLCFNLICRRPTSYDSR
ncbi:unnamed protein product [Musa acuminata var. zebrina]